MDVITSLHLYGKRLINRIRIDKAQDTIDNIPKQENKSTLFQINRNHIRGALTKDNLKTAFLLASTLSFPYIYIRL